MKMRVKIFAIFAVLSLVLLLLYFYKSEEKGSIVLEEWVGQYLDDEETILCKQKIKNDYYFLSVKGNVYKTGYLLNVGENINKPYAYIFSWGFQDENNNYLVSDVPSKNIIKRYVYGNNIVYSESIDTRVLNTENSNRMRVSIINKMYEDKRDVPRDIDEVVKNDSSAEYLLCDTPVDVVADS